MSFILYNIYIIVLSIRFLLLRDIFFLTGIVVLMKLVKANGHPHDVIVLPHRCGDKCGCLFRFWFRFAAPVAVQELITKRVV